MKKIVISVLALVVLPLSVFASGRYIEYNRLPNKAKQFLETYFAGVKVLYAEQERNSYEVNLENGVEVEFMKMENGKALMPNMLHYQQALFQRQCLLV